MKKKIICTLIGCGLCLAAQAADIFTRNVIGDLSTTNVWNPNIVPTSTDVAVWANSNGNGSRTNALGADVSWQGIRVADNISRDIIMNTTGVGTLTLGASGIDMSAVPVNSANNLFTIKPDVILGAAQTWDVAETTTFDRVLTIDGSISGGGGSTLTKSGAGRLNLAGTNNTFIGGLVVKEGVVAFGNSVVATGVSTAAGTGAITLGDAAGGDASLTLGSYTLDNAINLATGAAGNLKIGTSGVTRAPKYAGAIALNGNNLTIEHRSGQNIQVLGGITGAGNLILTNGLAGGIKLIGGSINNTGSILMSGNGSTMTTNSATAVIGANVTTITVGDQVTFILSATNAYTGGSTVQTGGVLIGEADGAFGAGAVTVADGASLVLTNGVSSDYIDDAANLVLGASATLNLDFTGTDAVGGISLDGGATFLSNGTYSAVDLGGFGAGTYTGTGSLAVGGLSGYTTWAGGWGVSLGAATDDYDNDGLLNIYEYGLGGDPTNAASQGHSPGFRIENLGGTNYFGYVY
ncbi:MAG: hypothetical protein K9M54_08400, partial [Kiritimatiellales bacterium]|nr:hypothetical protein [Kiritimatiellales bacterium]